MPESYELDLKLLDKALERHAAGRQIFLRDLKIAATIGTLFLFGIFFRFVDLSDRQLELKSQLHEVTEAQAALAAIKTGLVQIGDILRAQGDEVRHAIRSAQPELRARINAFCSEAARMNQDNSAASDVSNAGPDNAVQSAPQVQDQPAPSLSLLSKESVTLAVQRLTKDQLPLFRSSDSNRVADQIRAIVNSHIVPSVFNELNQKKMTKLDDPINRTIESLNEPLTVRNAVLNKLGWDPTPTRQAIDDVRQTLQMFVIHPPANADWWRTVESKGRAFEASEAEAGNAFSHLHEVLSNPATELVNLERNLVKLTSEANQNKSELDSLEKSLNADSTTVQSLIAGVAKPFASLALEPSTVVRYTPAIFAVGIVFFLVRFTLLRSRQTSLMKACQDLGYSESAVAIYFEGSFQSDIADPINLQSGRTFTQKSMIILLFAVPGILALISAWRVWVSTSLSHEAPLSTYSVTITAMIIAYGIVALPTSLRS